MKVLLLNPPSGPGTIVNRDVMGGFGTLQGRTTLLSSMPPLKLAYVAAMLERGGFTVQIQDSVLEAHTEEEALNRARQARPDVTGMETSLETIDADLKTASSLKECAGAPIFMLGAFASVRPGYILEHPGIEFVVREEPEETSLELVKYLSCGNKDYSDIKGLSYRSGGNVLHNPDRPPLENLSLLPHPARHLLENGKYICDKEEPGVTILGSRGCPVYCPYCPYASVQGPKWRCRKPRDIVDEIKEVYGRYKIKYFQFRDAIFTFDRAWISEICGLIAEEGLGDTISWICETAVKYLDKELLAQMKRAGCRHVGIGVETGDEALQKKYAKNKIISNEHAIGVFKACRSLGLTTCSFFMLGFPEEDAAAARKSIDLAKRLDSDEIQFTIVTPYPGTRITEAFGKVKRALSDEELEQLRKTAYLEFYSRPGKVLREMADPVIFFRKLKRGIGLLRGKK